MWLAEMEFVRLLGGPGSHQDLGRWGRDVKREMWQQEKRKEMWPKIRGIEPTRDSTQPHPNRNDPDFHHCQTVPGPPLVTMLIITQSPCKINRSRISTPILPVRKPRLGEVRGQ